MTAQILPRLLAYPSIAVAPIAALPTMVYVDATRGRRASRRQRYHQGADARSCQERLDLHRADVRGEVSDSISRSARDLAC
ncbi:MAG: hypothetical protein ABIO45_08185 [Burkholderiaceae bacterium]